MTEEMAESLKKNRTLPVGNDYVFDTIVSLARIHYPAQNRQVWVWKKQRPYDNLPF